MAVPIPFYDNLKNKAKTKIKKKKENDKQRREIFKSKLQ